MRLTCEGFSQEYLYKLGFTPSDAYVLRWFLSFTQSGNQQFIDYEGNRYYWIKYSKVIHDLPILKIKNLVVVGNLFRRLCGQGLENECDYPLEKYNVWDSKRNYVYFRFRPEVLELMENAHMNSLIDNNPIQPKKIIKDKDFHRVPYNPNVYELYQKLKTIKENGKMLFINHTLPTDKNHYNSTFTHFQESMLCLYEGRFLTTYSFDKLQEWFKTKYKYYFNKDQIIEAVRNCKGSWKNINNLIMKAANNYSKWFNVNTEVSDKHKLPRSINDWIYSSGTGCSMFYVCLLKPPTEAREANAENIFNKINPIYRKIFSHFYKEDWDGFAFWNKINNIIKWYKIYSNDLLRKDSNCLYWMASLNTFLIDYDSWLTDFTNNNPNLKNIGIDNATWDCYIKEKVKEHGIEIQIPRSL